MGPTATSFNAGEMLKKLTTGDQVALGACLLFFVFTFFPWIGIDGDFVSVTQSGFHGWGVVAWLLMLVTAGFVLVRTPLLSEQVQLPALPVLDWMIVAGGGALTLLCTLLYWVEYHESQTVGTISIGTTQKFGWYVALLSALGIAAGGYLKQTDPQPEARVAGPGYAASPTYAPPSTYPPPPPPAPPPQQAQPQYGAPQYGTPPSTPPAPPAPPAGPPASEPETPPYGTPPRP